MDIRDRFIAVHTEKGEKRNMAAVTKQYFHAAYRTLDKTEVLNDWFRALRRLSPPPSGLDILQIVCDDIIQNLYWKRAVKEVVYQSWKQY